LTAAQAAILVALIGAISGAVVGAMQFVVPVIITGQGTISALQNILTATAGTSQTVVAQVAQANTDQTLTATLGTATPDATTVVPTSTPTPSATNTATATSTETPSLTPMPVPKVSVAIFRLGICTTITPEQIKNALPPTADAALLPITLVSSDQARTSGFANTEYALIVWGSCDSTGKLIFRVEAFLSPGDNTGLYLAERQTFTLVSPNLSRATNLVKALVAYLTGGINGNYIALAANFSSLQSALGADAIFLRANSLLLAGCFRRAAELYDSLPHDVEARNNLGLAEGLYAVLVKDNDESTNCPQPSVPGNFSDDAVQVLSEAVKAFEEASILAADDPAKQALIAANKGILTANVGDMSDAQQQAVAEAYCKTAIGQSQTNGRGNLCLAEVRLNRHYALPLPTWHNSCTELSRIQDVRDDLLSAAESVPQLWFWNAYIKVAELRITNPDCAVLSQADRKQLTHDALADICSYIDALNQQPVVLYHQQVLRDVSRYQLLPYLTQTEQPACVV
jgi:hypothetical protein